MADEVKPPQQIDIPDTAMPVQVEYDEPRGVLYVHVDGYSALRLKTKFPVEFLHHRPEAPGAGPVHTGLISQDR